MYPYLYFGDLTLSMTGIGIVLSFFLFVFIVYVQANKENLKFNVFFSNLIIFVLLVHILGKYFFLVLEYKIYFPNSYKEIMFFLPNISGFQYHFVGLLLACFLFFIWFLKYKVKRILRNKWINILFQAFTISFIPLGFFLLLGDNFIGKNTNSFISVHSFSEESNLSAFDKIYPVGIFLSIGSFFVFLIKRFIDTQTKQKNGYLGLGLLLIMLSIVFLFQKYTRHFVDPFGLVKSSNEILVAFFSSIDIKQYILWITAIWMFYLQNKSFKKDIEEG